MDKAVPSIPPQGAWKIAAWGPAAEMSKSFVYQLFGTALEPKNINIGAARFITESPAEYFARIAKLKKSKAPKRKASGAA